MTEILNEENERIYATGTKRYRLGQDTQTTYPGESKKYGVDVSVWSGKRWMTITIIYRENKEDAFAEGKKLIVAFHDGE